MKCSFHSKNEAVATCTNCGRFICEECNVDIYQKSVCKSCIESKSIFNNEFSMPVGEVKVNKIKYSKVILFLLSFLTPIGFNYLYMGLKNRDIFFLRFTIILYLINIMLPTIYIPWVIFSIISFIDTLKIREKIHKGIYVNDNTKDIFNFIKLYKSHIISFITSVTLLFYLCKTLTYMLINTYVFIIIVSLLSLVAIYTGIYLLFNFLSKQHLFNYDFKPIEQDTKATKEKFIENKADKFIDDGILMAELIDKKSYDLINTNIGSQVKQISEITNRIFEFVKKHPYKARNLKKFVEYYLPTTLKLLENYEHLLEQGLIGKNIIDTSLKIEKMLYSLQKAFEKQLDNLFEDKALDIDAEINVLSDILKREGLME